MKSANEWEVFIEHKYYDFMIDNYDLVILQYVSLVFKRLRRLAEMNNVFK